MKMSELLELPKLDLHCHLDGSMRPQTVRTLLAEQGIFMPEEALQKELQVSIDCTSLTEYLQRFDIPIQCLQTGRGLKLAVFDLLGNAARENVRYLEVRFAPMFCLEKGLTCGQVIESVLAGIAQAQEKWNIHASVIVCAMRHHSVETNLQMIHCAREYLGQGVCALDLAGDESSFPTREQRELFRAAKQLDMPFTIHSGECGSVENVREAIELGAKRLGHGIALQQDTGLMELCRKSRIGIEMCPTSNFQTKAISSWEEYPLERFLDEGLLATINTDNRTVSDTTVTKELFKVSERLGFERERIVQLQRNAIEISFAEDGLKHRLLTETKG